MRGAQVPYPYGGKPRVIMVDLDQEALQARGLTPADVTDALLEQNVILPSGDVKIGNNDYAVAMNNSPDIIATHQRISRSSRSTAARFSCATSPTSTTASRFRPIR